MLPKTQREAWLQTVALKGGENGRVDGGLTAFAMSAGPLAFEVAGSVAGSTKLNADAFQALMFGNAGRTGSPQDLDLKGSNMRVGAFTTAAASYGLSLGHFALGVTGKYVLGNALAHRAGSGHDAPDATRCRSTFRGSTRVRIRTRSLARASASTSDSRGRAGKFAFGATVQNVMNSFAWDETKLFSSAATALFDGTNGIAEHRRFTVRERARRAARASGAGQVQSDRRGGRRLRRRFAARAVVRRTSADGRRNSHRPQDAGVRRSGCSRAARCCIFAAADRTSPTAGVHRPAFGLDLGGYELGVGAALRSVNGGKEPIVTLNLLSIPLELND